MGRLRTKLQALSAADFTLPALWVALTAVSLATRPLIPVDETRYASVAWEMWVRHDFLVPHLNGEAYSHKPPLLFWLIDLSWRLFGVNDWTFRLVAPLFGLAALYLVKALARTLWPASRQTADLAPVVLLGFAVWQVYAALTMFDIMLALSVVTGMYALASSARAGLCLRRRLLLGAAVAGGIFSKGPVIFLHLLPTALLAPVWVAPDARRFSWPGWYGGLLLSILLGAAFALCWAVPAGLAGGEAYRNAIFLGQTQGRLVESFAHQQPWWWYLEVLPVLLLPWLFMKPLWLGWRRLETGDGGVRFCLAWLLPVFLGFSLVSGKQPHYLLPLMPALALIVARTLELGRPADVRRSHRPVMIVAGLLGVGGVIAAFIDGEFSPACGLLLTALAAAGFALSARGLKQAVLYVATATLATVLIAGACFFSARAERYDTAIVGRKIAEFEQAGRPVVFFGSKYHGQYHFTGRLRRPFTVITAYPALEAFAARHPDCVVVVSHGNSALLNRLADFAAPYKSKTVGLLSCSKLAGNPELARELTS